MTSLQKTFAENVTRAVGDGRLAPLVRHMFRCIMGTLPRGGGNGDDIRMGILNILRTHGIKEGYRPGIEDVFLGQWHQKLHSSTTVDETRSARRTCTSCTPACGTTSGCTSGTGSGSPARTSPP